MADPDDEGFLARWSRLKREGPPAAAASEPPAEQDAAGEEAAEPADAATLPPVESLDADSDYTRFLAVEVPQELRLAALRKAWVSDPKIAGFRGFAEYDWDCNAPGYGQLLPTDSIRDMVEAMFREEPAENGPAEDGEGVKDAAGETPVAEGTSADTDDGEKSAG